MEPKDQALQALAALYGSPNPDTKKEANGWLTNFQQSPQAWQVADQILSNPETPVQYRFFAAQTMRTKVQFDFYELPVESYASLRDSLLSHIDKFRVPPNPPECQPIHTMLAIAVADLAIQMDTAWPNVVELLFERFGQNGDSYATLLEILRMLPEENMNYKLMTDSHKRHGSKERLQQAAPQVVQFLLTLQCPTMQAKKKVLECFLSWIKFTNLQAGLISQNPLIPELVKLVADGGELSETATDILTEILRMCSLDLTFFQPVIQVILSLLGTLRAKFEALLSRGVEAALDADQDGILQICRIYVETGECLVPLIMEQSTNPEVLSILRVILQCTDLPLQEISFIPLEFWHRLANEVCRHPETDAKIDQFQGIYVELLSVCCRRCQLPANEDPFQGDNDLGGFQGDDDLGGGRRGDMGEMQLTGRHRLLNLAEDCIEILTPNSALEHVLKSLTEVQAQGVLVQEAHFFCLTIVAAKAEVRKESVLWSLIQSLPPLISKPVDGNSLEGSILQFTKKTSIELLGNLSKWLRTRPDILRLALEMISQILVEQTPQGMPPQMLDRVKQTQQAASVAFEDICLSGRQHLVDLMPQLTQLYVATMPLPIKMHLSIVRGIGNMVANLRDDSAFQSGLEQMVTPLVTGLNSEKEKPQVLSEILDRMTTIIRQIDVGDGSSKSIICGTVITNAFWPLIRQTISQHPGDSKVVEKSCRLLKHSMRCVPDLFKPNVPQVVETLIVAFQLYQHSSYLYSAEILADTYKSDPEIVPTLKHLFNQLSSTGLQCLMNASQQGKLADNTELVEDFYGMFERYMRHVPVVVMEAPTLGSTLQLWHDVIFVQQQDAIQAVVAFIESVLSRIAELAKPMQRYTDEAKALHGQQLRPVVIQVMPGLVVAIFKLMADVPTRYMQDHMIPPLVESIRGAFPGEFPGWLEAALQVLPPSAVSRAEQQKIGEQLVRGDENQVYNAVQDLCYRCEQVALRSAEQGKKKK